MNRKPGKPRRKGKRKEGDEQKSGVQELQPLVARCFFLEQVHNATTASCTTHTRTNTLTSIQMAKKADNSITEDFNRGCLGDS